MKTIFSIFALAALLLLAKTSSASLRYEADIKIDVTSGSVSGKVTMSGTEETALYIPSFYDLKLDGRPVLTRAAMVNMPLMGGKSHVLEYKKGDSGNDSSSEEFISLSNLAPLPLTESLVEKTFTVSLPKGFDAIGEAETIIKTTAKAGGEQFTFKMNKPLSSFDIIASKNYVVKSAKTGNTEVYAYFFKDNADLVEDYLKSAVGYIKMYEELFKSPFPYKRFSIVEHKSPYGYATPGYTVLGSQVLRLPFITKTSLGHETLHQWFGSAIDGINNENWFEAITVYFADMFYLSEPEKEAYRKNIMINYDIFDSDNKTYPLKNFRFNDSRLSQTIGYGKGAMVFHMLENRLGKEKFYEGIRKFIKEYTYKRADWGDLLASFEGADLKDFENFWLNSKEVPSITVSGAEYIIEKGNALISFHIKRESGEEIMNVPYTIIYSDSEEEGVLVSRKGSEAFNIPVKAGAVKLVIDKDYDIMRKLSKDETPATINHLMEADKILLVTDDKNSCEPFFNTLKNVAGVKKASELTFSEAASNNLIICGYENDVARGLIGSQKSEGSTSEYFAFKNNRSPDKFAMVVANPTKENLRLINHYGKYSKLRFDGRKNILKEINPSSVGIVVLERKEDMAVIPETLKTLDEVVKGAKKSSAIFIGERHDNYAHHLNQLAIIAKLKESGAKIAVGFEMIQKQFQNVLDDYINGKISEGEFLKKSEYFDRWSFDYNLYAPIFRYLRDNKIDAIALNIDGAINRKISSGMGDNISIEEKSALPREMNLLNDTYLNEIGEIFKMHGVGSEFGKKFSDFFLAQNVWDEVMAEAVVDYQRKNPDKIVVVVAGGGHLKKDSGIPLRYARLTGKEGFVILQDEAVDKNKADAVLFTSSVAGTESPKIGISISQDKDAVIIESVSENSPASKAGFLPKDRLIKCGDTEIKNINDLRYVLFESGYGAELICSIERKKRNATLKVKLEKQAPDSMKQMEQMMKMMNKKP